MNPREMGSTRSESQTEVWRSPQGDERRSGEANPYLTANNKRHLKRCFFVIVEVKGRRTLEKWAGDTKTTSKCCF